MDLHKLNAALKGNGYLGNARVSDAKFTAFKTAGIASEMFSVVLTYTSDDHSLPDRMIVKCPNLTDRGVGEARVYNEILRPTNDLPIITCYAIVDDDPEKGLNFFFEDLSHSHHQTPWPIIPNLNDCFGAVAALARIHAEWWGRTSFLPDIIPPVASHQTPSHLSQFFPDFADFVGEYLSSARLQLYERLFEQLDSLLNQRLSAVNRTLLHTDSHFWNFLYAKNGDPASCVIFDWPLWNTGLGGSDLAYMIALHLYPEHRERFELPMLDCYHQTLTSHGITYGREDVQLDYRIGVIIGLLMPVMEFSWNIAPHDWIPKLEKALAAFERLHCSELLEAA